VRAIARRKEVDDEAEHDEKHHHENNPLEAAKLVQH